MQRLSGEPSRPQGMRLGYRLLADCEVCTPREIDKLEPPLNLLGFEPRMDAVPGLGEHTRAILEELGYTGREVEALAVSGAI